VHLMERVRPKRASPVVSVVAAFVLLIALLVTVAALIAPSLIDQATTLGDRLPALVRRSGAIESWPWPSFMKPYADRIATFIRAQLETGATAALPFAQRIGAGLVEIASNLIFVVLIPVLAFLLIVSGPRIQRWLRSMLARAQDPTWASIIDDLHHLVGSYIRALLLLSMCAFAAYAVFLSAIGVPYGLLLASAAAILEFIPVFGPLIAALVIVAVAVVTDYPHVLWIVVFIVAFRLCQDYVVAPKLMSAGVGVHPILVIFGLLAGEQLGGVAGIFVSVPLIAAATIVARHLRKPR